MWERQVGLAVDTLLVIPYHSRTTRGGMDQRCATGVLDRLTCVAGGFTTARMNASQEVRTTLATVVPLYWLHKYKNQSPTLKEETDLKKPPPYIESILHQLT